MTSGRKKTSSPEQGQSAGNSTVRDDAVMAALTLAAKIGWDMVTLTDIADEAGLGLAELREIFDNKNDVLIAYERMIDRKVLEKVGPSVPDDVPRDRLFEILMERFDVLNEHRGAVKSMLETVRLDPKQGAIGLSHVGGSMAWMLEAAGIGTGGFKGAVRIIGLSVIYLNALRIWLRDDTDDMAQTMATIDRNLGTAEQFANTLSL